MNVEPTARPAPIPQMEPWFDEKEADALAEYMRQGGWITEFKKTQEFEEALAQFCDSRHCIATNNGTISLTLALLAIGVEPGDEIIVPNLTMIATPNSAQLLGAIPKFVDIEANTLCLDLRQAEAAISSKTKAIVHVSFNGRSNNVKELRALCDRRGIILVEDAAQSLGSYYGAKHLGTIGHIGSFSFSAPKVISTGQGGALVTDDDSLAAKIRKLKDFGRASGGHDTHDSIGYNFKFTDLQAVVGIQQMQKLPWRLERKKAIYRRYQENLKGLELLEMVPTDLSQTAPWFIDVYVPNPSSLRARLADANIGSRPIYPPIHKQKAYGLTNSFPVTEHYSARGLWLPSSSKLSDDQIDYVCENIQNYFKGQ